MKVVDLPCDKNEWVCLDRKGQRWPDNYTNPDTGKPYHCFDCSVSCANGTSGGGGGGGDSDPTADQFCDNRLMAVTMVGVILCGCCVDVVWRLERYSRCLETDGLPVFIDMCWCMVPADAFDLSSFTFS